MEFPNVAMLYLNQGRAQGIQSAKIPVNFAHEQIAVQNLRYEITSCCPIE
jgi:hypothetical protein